MDYSRYSKMKLGALSVALLVMSACSSSKVEDGSSAAPPETAADASLDAVPQVEASTDAVPAPPVDSNAAVTENPDLAQAAAAEAAPPVAAADPNAIPPVVDAPPAGDANTASASNDLPAAPPAVEAAPEAIAPSVADATPPAASSGDAVQYKVKKGDTLMKVAFENYGDLYRWKEIYEANRGQIQDPNNIPPGTQLSLNGAGMVTVERNGDRYLIKHGDTLGIISDGVYGTPRKWKKLWENNRQLIKDPNRIYAGFFLYYQPEGRLTHGDEEQVGPASTSEAPAVIDNNPSAKKTAKSDAARVPASKQ